MTDNSIRWVGLDCDLKYLDPYGSLMGPKLLIRGLCGSTTLFTCSNPFRTPGACDGSTESFVGKSNSWDSYDHLDQHILSLSKHLHGLHQNNSNMSLALARNHFANIQMIDRIESNSHQSRRSESRFLMAKKK